jgi:hypothetical protein
MKLSEMVKDEAVKIDQIAAYLDGLSPDEQVREVHSLGRAGQRALYQKASAAPPAKLEDFVPPEKGVRSAVKHRGRNTLPLPPAFKNFEKVFCRAEGTPRLFGYNEGASRPLIGPGYFVGYSTQGKGEWESRGSIVIDYFQVPDGPVAEGWPQVVPNSKGLQKFVFNGTRDFMRRVSSHVTVGAAYKGEKALDHYFILFRQ